MKSINQCAHCVECLAECDNCISCPDLLRVCDTCLSCPYFSSADFCKAQSICDKSTLTISHVNIRSVTANFGQIEDMLSVCLKTNILALSETRLNSNSDLNFVQIEGYKFIHKDSLTRAGGTGMYISNLLKHTPICLEGCLNYI